MSHHALLRIIYVGTFFTKKFMQLHYIEKNSKDFLNFLSGYIYRNENILSG